MAFILDAASAVGTERPGLTDAEGASVTPSQPAVSEAKAIGSEEELLVRCGQGDADAFSQLYDRTVRPLHHLARRFCSEPAEAEDVVHDAFVSAWKHASEYSPERGTAFSWLATLVRNRAIDRMRVRKRRAEILESAAHEDVLHPAAHGDEGSSIDVSLLHEAVRALPEELRTPLVLSHYRGMTHVEVAQQLRIPVGTVKTRLRRSLERLKEFFRSRP